MLEKTFNRLSREGVIEALVLILIWLYLLQYFKPDLLLLQSAISGGDTLSHYYPAEYMRDYLLPNLKIYGWSMGWYAGLPMFQYYFPFLFALSAIMGYAIPMQVSFKLVTALGTFLLPLCALLSMRLFGFKFPMPAVAAALTLPFLFIESNSMWGGNIPSTLAGEFSYSFSLSLTVLFLGALYAGIKKGNWFCRNAFLFAAITISHVYTMLWALLSSSFFLFKKDGFKKNLAYLFLVFSCGFLLVSFWLLPMLASLNYTTGYSSRWGIDKIEAAVPTMILPFVLLSAVSFPLALKRRDERMIFLYFTVAASMTLFFLMPEMGGIDIRVFPFAQLMATMLASYPISIFIERLKMKHLAVLILLFLVFLWINNNTSYISNWIKWNYEGFEKKPYFDEFLEINGFLKGGVSDARAVFEHSTSYERFGGIRSFEMLPLWSGRSETEGLFMQSSISAPFAFYMQSEYSDQISCPFPEFGCTSMNLTSAYRHLRMFNVKNVIVTSDRAKNEFSSNGLYRLVNETNKQQIYELVGTDFNYVYVPEYYPVFFETSDWAKTSYEWFKRQSGLDVPLVFSSEAREKLALEAKALSELPRKEIARDCAINETIKNEEISFVTDCVGIPHIIRISYHPYWSVQGADAIYLVSPSFMLVTPSAEKVVLKYGYSAPITAGYLLSALGVLLAWKLSRIRNVSSLIKR